MSDLVTFRLTVTGRVQGVGFRPFVCRMAKALSLTGWVKNWGGIVEIRASGRREALFALEKDLKEAPYPIFVESIREDEVPYTAFDGFSAIESGGHAVEPLFPADIGICPTCRKELHDRRDRHYRYPFISCPACGPRYTIIHRLPYDRENTTMDGFPLCPDCEREYHDENDRRCHGETISCPACGPLLTADLKDGHPLSGEEAMERAVSLVKEGNIIMVKSMGGFHLVCRGDLANAVIRLRQLKHREGKPFALMVHSLKEAEALADLTEEDRRLLTSPACPIVLCRPKTVVLPSVAEGVPRLGLFLPSNGFYDILTEEVGAPLIVTSANLSKEPVLYKDGEAHDWFQSHRVSGFFTNNRDILRPADDSVMKAEGAHLDMVRRTRGFLPEPVIRSAPEGQVLAMGADMEPSFCLTGGGRMYPGELPCDFLYGSSKESFRHMEEDWEQMLGIHPEKILCDLHPMYESAFMAEEMAGKRGIPCISVQHHHAHALSVMAEHGLSGKAAAFVFDGTGCGTDYSIWGGEILLLEGPLMKRAGHLDSIPMIGGDLSMQQAWKSAFCSMVASGETSNDPRFPVVQNAVWQGMNCVNNSSMGRLFDSASAILHLKEENRYKGECAMALERAAQEAMAEGRKALPLHLVLEEREGVLIWNRDELIHGLVASDGKIKEGALGFHRAIVEMVVKSAELLGVEQVLLTGGCFHNSILWNETRNALEKRHFKVYGNEKVPCGDGGISLGQAWYGLLKG